MGFLKTIGSAIGSATGISAILNAASGIAGGLIGKSSSDSAAQAQLQATRETNRNNYMIARENNEYNNIVNQRKRFEEAGLNPNLMLDGASSIAADTSGTQQVPDMSSLAAGGLQLGQSIASAGQNIAQMVYQNNLQKAQAAKVNAEAEGIVKDNTYKDADYALKFANMAADTNQKNKQRDLLQWELSFKELAKQNMLKQIDLQNSQLDSQVKLNIVSAAYQSVEANKASFELKWLPKKFALEADQIVAETVAAQAAAGASRAQAEAAVEQALLSKAQAAGVRIDNEVKDSAKRYSVNIIRNTSAKLYQETKGLETDNETTKKWKDTWSWKTGEHARNLFGGWLPLSGSINKSVK